MGKILDAFAMDSLTVEPVTYEGNEEYKKARELSCELWSRLIARLDEEERGLLDEYLDAQLEEDRLYAANRFVSGYRLGVMMTMEVFDGTGHMYGR